MIFGRLRVYRMFSSSIQTLEILHKTLRETKKLDQNILLDVDQNVLCQMSDFQFQNFTYSLSAKQKPSDQYISVCKITEKMISERSKFLRAEYCIRLLKNIFYLEENNKFQTDPQVIAKLIKRISYFSPDLISETNAEEILHFVKYLKNHQIDYEYFFVNKLKSYRLKSVEAMSMNKLSAILKVISELDKFNPEFMRSHGEWKELLDTIESTICKRIDENLYTIDELAKAFRSFILLDVGSEDFFRKIEEILFANLSKLSTPNFVALPSYYSKRILFDYNYIINLGYKSIYEEAVRRFDDISPSYLNYFLMNYVMKSNYYGMYCDNRLSEKITSFDFSRVKAPEVYSLAINMFSYLNNSRSNNAKFTEAVFQVFKGKLDQLEPWILASLAIQFARAPDSPKEFWVEFSKHADRAYSEKPEFLNTVEMTLRLQSPEKYEIIKDAISPYIEKAKEIWIKARSNDLKKSPPGFVHKALEFRLQELNIEYISEYFDGYYMDLVIPKFKICIEILGPGHYLHPSKTITGVTYAKKKNLEKLGWSYYEIPFFRRRNDQIWVNDAVNKILPLSY